MTVRLLLCRHRHSKAAGFSAAICLLASLLVSPVVAVDFAHDVLPVLKQHCAECHTGTQKKGGLSMNTRAALMAGGENGEVIEPGDSFASYLIELIESDDDTEWMPPKGPRLTPPEIDILKKWIDTGMKWDESITLGKSSWEPPLKPRAVELPAAQNNRNHPIDRILDAGMIAAKIPLPSATEDATFLRRVNLDITGLLPTPDELQAFTAAKNPDKRSKKIDELLADDIGYADHWLTTWNDLLRNDYTGTGFITKGRTQITTWLYRSLRENKPYDQFVSELIAPPNTESAGFINGIKWRGDVNSSQTRDIQFSQNISQVFLGINMKCASCHDSFIDRWKLDDAYNLAAIFSEEPLELNRCDKPIGVTATPKWIFPELGDIDPNAKRDDRLKQLAGLMTHAENGRFTRTVVNRIWERLMGRGIVHPVDAMDTEPWNEDLLDYLAMYFAEQKYDLKKLIRFVMNSNAYRAQSVILEKEPGEDYIFSGPLAKRMTAEQFLDSIWQVTETHPASSSAKVDRVPGTAEPLIGRSEMGEIDAHWIWHNGEPGTSSQLWKTFDLKTKPEACILMATCDNEFRFKVNNKEIAHSKVWTEPVYLDIAEYLKAGKNSIIVDASMHGGAFGFVCQLFIKETDQPVIKIATDASWKARPNKNAKWTGPKLIAKHGSQPWGAVLDVNAAPRTGLTPPVRAALVKNDFLMRSLGRPHRDQVVTTRPNGLTTLQAIDLANGDILAKYLKSGAQQLVKTDGAELGNWLYQFSLSRNPSEGEAKIITEVLQDENRTAQSVEDLLWLVFMQPEFQMIR